MNIAIIPARGGSKRIPGKNIREFCGKPMIAYSIEAAQNSGCFERIMVSTDDAAVAAVAVKYGAEAPFLRPAALSDDHTALDAVLHHAVEWLDAQGVELTYVCCVFATAPFLTGAILRDGLALLQSAPHRQYAFSVASYPFPIQRAIRITADNGVEPFHPECIPVRSQDLEAAYHEAGQFFWGRPDALLRRLSIYAPGVSVPVHIPRYRVQDIDTMEDWIRAECLFQALKVMQDDENRI